MYYISLFWLYGASLDGQTWKEGKDKETAEEEKRNWRTQTNPAKSEQMSACQNHWTVWLVRVWLVSTTIDWSALLSKRALKRYRPSGRHRPIFTNGKKTKEANVYQDADRVWHQRGCHGNDTSNVEFGEKYRLLQKGGPPLSPTHSSKIKTKTKTTLIS